jgi:esterase/lipase
MLHKVSYLRISTSYFCLFFLVCLSVIFTISSCVCLKSSQLYQHSFPALQRETSHPCAGVILIPGLNLRPDALNEIANQFISQGLQARIVSLHKPMLSEHFSGQQMADMWANQVRDEYQALRDQLPDKPMLLFGYSLGTLLALNLVLEQPEDKKTLFLLAPPLELRMLPNFLLKLTRLLPASVLIASAAPERYRIQPWTLAAEYQALNSVRNQLDKKLQLLSQERLSGVVLLSSQDEFVSDSGVSEILQRYTPKLEQRILSLQGGSYGHLMLDQYSLGEQGWHELSEAIKLLVQRFNC